MALEDLGGPSAYGGGLQVDPTEAEAMRDRALAQYMDRKQALERERQHKAAQMAAEPEESADFADAYDDYYDDYDDAAERLAEIPGLGPAKIDALLEEFESLEAVAEANEDELVRVNGIGRRLAAEIVATLR